MIELTLELYLDNKKLLAGSEEDLAIGVSNIMHTNITDVGIIALAKSLNGHKRSTFLRLIVESKYGDHTYATYSDQNLMEKTNELSNNCKPWVELFKDVKKKSTKMDKQIIEYEIANLYLNTINGGEKGFIKKINLELAW